MSGIAEIKATLAALADRGGDALNNLRGTFVALLDLQQRVEQHLSDSSQPCVQQALAEFPQSIDAVNHAIQHLSAVLRVVDEYPAL